MKRLTKQHYKKTDGYYMKCSEHCCKEDFSCEDCEKFDELVDRLAAIEDILGDEYDLDCLSPCILCQFNPPSSSNGKPCCMCPAQAALRREQDGE